MAIKRTDTGKKLFVEKKKMNKETLQKWTDWCKGEKPDMSKHVWYQIITGSYISKDNELFAIHALAKGMELNNEYKDALNAAKLAARK